MKTLASGGHKQLLVVGPQWCQSTICLQQMRHNGAREPIYRHDSVISLQKNLSRKISPEKSLDFWSRKSVLRPALKLKKKRQKVANVNQACDTAEQPLHATRLDCRLVAGALCRCLCAARAHAIASARPARRGPACTPTGCVPRCRLATFSKVRARSLRVVVARHTRYGSVWRPCRMQRRRILVCPHRLSVRLRIICQLTLFCKCGTSMTENIVTCLALWRVPYADRSQPPPGLPFLRGSRRTKLALRETLESKHGPYEASASR